MNMKIYTTYEKEENEATEPRVQIKPVLDFFRREIDETRNLTRQLSANKSYSQKLVRLAKTPITQ